MSLLDVFVATVEELQDSIRDLQALQRLVCADEYEGMDAWCQILLPNLWGRLSRLDVELKTATLGAAQAWQGLAIPPSMSLRELSVSFKVVYAQDEAEGSAIVSRLIRLAPEIQSIQLVKVPLELELISAVSSRSKCTHLRLLPHLTAQPELATFAPLVNARSLRHFTFGYEASTQHPTSLLASLPISLELLELHDVTQLRGLAAFAPLQDITRLLQDKDWCPRLARIVLNNLKRDDQFSGRRLETAQKDLMAAADGRHSGRPALEGNFFRTYVTPSFCQYCRQTDLMLLCIV